jgi:hypothetical protein
MFTVELAGVPVEIDNRYGFVEAYCREYQWKAEAGNEVAPAFRVSVTEGKILTYMQTCGHPMTKSEAECALLYREICGRMPAYDALLLHAAVLSVDGRGYAFSARRGVGKTTHISMWQAAYGSRVTVVNGDKPLLRRGSDGHWRVYGTPWCGKEGYETNTDCPLTALCFLEQGQENRMTPNPAADTAARILEGTILPPEPAMQDRMATLVGALVREVPAFRLVCLPQKSAAELAYATLAGVL